MSDASYVNERVDKLQSEINRMADKIKEQFRTVDRKFQNQDQELQNHQEEIMALNEGFSRQLQQLENYFLRFQNLLERVQSATEDGNRLIKNGNDRIVSGLLDSTETSRIGLSKISSGMALVEAVEARSASLESMTAIVRAVDEIADRFEQAEIAVMERKANFTRHYEETLKGFQSQLHNIASHIFEILQKGFSDFDSIRVDPRETEAIQEVLESVQKTRLTARRNLVDDEFRRLNLASLKQVIQRRDELRQLVDGGGALSFVSDEAIELPVGYFSAAAVSTDGSAKIETSLDAGATDAEATYVRSNEMHAGLEAMKDYCSGSIVADGMWADHDLGELFLALSNLHEAGILRSDHYELINEHLTEHSLQKLTIAPTREV